MEGELSAKALSTELRTGLAFLTRLKLTPPAPIAGAEVARASWTFPVIGAGIGLLGAIVYWLAHGLGLDPLLGGTLAVAATMLVTGALHEDGLADTADGFGGGQTAARKLEIMRDSSIGAYGAAALILSFLLRAGAIASIAEPGLVALALIAAHAGARATLPIFMRRVPRAREDGLSAQAGAPLQQSAAIAVAIGAALLWLCLGFGGALVTLILLVAALALAGWLATNQIGGQTGDVLGAVEQASEVLILLVAASRF
ncbi:MAG: adenosylcobinamide-GDP ribazoletransferase [Methyloceanibacter sp.]